MLLDKFFTVKQISAPNDTDYIVQVAFNANHDIFKGHFPDMPVVPGVCQVQMLKEVLSQIFSKDLYVNTASSIKFLNIIDPLKHPQLTMSIKAKLQDNGGWFVSADYFLADETFFRFKGELSAS